MFSIVKLIQAALMCSIFSMAAGHGIMEEKAHRLLAEKNQKTDNRAKNADEGKYKTYVSNKDANVQFEKGFFPYDPGEAYTGHYWQGKIFCFVLMFLAEIGDKTFIIVMISYTELGACVTFFAGYITLCAMHILAATLGWGISFVVPAFWTKLVATILFIVIAIVMFIMAFANRHPENVDAALGKSGHQVTLVVKEQVEAEDDTKKEGGDKDKSESESDEDGSDSDEDEDGSDSDEEEEEGESESKHSSSKKSSSAHESSGSEEGSGSDGSGESEESDSDSGSGGSNSDSDGSHEEKVKAKHLPKMMVRKPTKITIDPNTPDFFKDNQEFKKKQLEKSQKTDKHGIFLHHHDEYKSLKQTGQKLQNFCCCGMSKFVLFPFLLVAGEMCDKTQIVAVSMAPNYGFQSIVIGGIFAQFFSVLLAIFCAQTLGECIHNRFFLDLLAGLMFLIFGLYELIGELIMENSNSWAERKV